MFAGNIPSKTRSIIKLRKSPALIDEDEDQQLLEDMIDSTDLKLFENIGEGAFGVVRRGILFGQPVALKMIKGTSKEATKV